MQETLLTQRQIADNRTAVLNFLDLNGIKYTLQQHPAVFTMEELAAAGVENIEYILKNLFLRNANGKQHYLAAVCGEKTVDLKAIRAQLGCSAPDNCRSRDIAIITELHIITQRNGEMSKRTSLHHSYEAMIFHPRITEVKKIPRTKQIKNVSQKKTTFSDSIWHIVIIDFHSVCFLKKIIR